MFEIDAGNDDVVGVTELLGDSVDLVGAMVRAARNNPANAKLQAFAQQAIAMKEAASGTLVSEHDFTKSRSYPLGFDSGAVLIVAGANAPVTSQPQVVFRPDRLVVAGTVAPLFLIQSITIGKNAQFAANVPVPAEVFSQTAFGVRLKLDTAQINTQITINVTNFSAAGARFLAALIGPAVE